MVDCPHPRRATFVASACAIGLVACRAVLGIQDLTPTGAVDAGTDTAVEATADAANDDAGEVSVDAAHDATVEARSDAANDAVVEASAGDSFVGDVGDSATFDADALLGTGDGGSTEGDAIPACDVGIVDSGRIDDAVELALGVWFSCAVRSDGRVGCWGGNLSLELGVPTDGGISTALTVPLPGPAAHVAVGLAHACAVLTDRHVYCWGSNSQGQLGAGPGSVGSNAAPLEVVFDGGIAMTTAVAVSAGWSHSCALLGSGAVACWGDDSVGQTGTGVSSSYAAATTISGGADGLAAGFSHSCAHMTTGAVVCWGSNSFNQLGEDLPDGAASSNTQVPFDAAAAGSGPLAQVAATQTATCAIDSARNVYCAGYNLYGELGSLTAGSTLHTPKVVPEVTGMGVTAFALGPCHSCALTADTSVQCLGANKVGELGRGFTGAGHFSMAPVTMGDGGVLVGALAVAATGEGSEAIAHSCAIVKPAACATSGSVVCWGTNNYGQLGDGTTVNRSTPVRVIAPPN